MNQTKSLNLPHLVKKKKNWQLLLDDNKRLFLYQKCCRLIFFFCDRDPNLRFKCSVAQRGYLLSGFSPVEQKRGQRQGGRKCPEVIVVTPTLVLRPNSLLGCGDS